MKKSGLLILAALALAACGSSSSSEHPIEGKLIVHTRWKAPGADAVVPHVLLGDGSRFDRAVDANGDVVFQDASLQGPQTVTMVVGNEVTTVVGINRDELWMAWASDTSVGSDPVATISGKVTGQVASTDVVQVEVLAPYGGTTQANADGSYSLPVFGPADAGTTSLVAYDYDADQTQLRRVGLRRDVPVAAQIWGQDVSLDHPLNRAIAVSVPTLAPYGSSTEGTLSAVLDQQVLFTTSADGGTNLVLPSIETTAPFDTVQFEATVKVGDPSSLPAGQIRVTAPVTTRGANLSLAPPARLTAPAIGTERLPAGAPLSGFLVAWNAGAPWQAIQMEVEQPDHLTWTVTAPAGASSFQFFPLPADASPVSGFSNGTARITVDALQADGLPSFEALYGDDARSLLKASLASQSEEFRGFVILQ